MHLERFSKVPITLKHIGNYELLSPLITKVSALKLISDSFHWPGLELLVANYVNNHQFDKKKMSKCEYFMYFLAFCDSKLNIFGL